MLVDMVNVYVVEDGRVASSVQLLEWLRAFPQPSAWPQTAAVQHPGLVVSRVGQCDAI